MFVLTNIAGVNSGLIGGLIAFILLAALTPLIKKLAFKINSKKHERYSRDLTLQETSWLSQNAKELAQETSNHEYPKSIYLLWSGTFPVILGMGTIFGLTYLAYKNLLKPIDPEALSWSRIDLGVSAVLAAFLGIFVAALVMIFLAKRSKHIRDYLTYVYGWGYMSPRPRNEVEIYEELEHQVRIENLSHNDAYDSEHFSNLIFHRTSPAWHKWTLGIFFITLFFLVLDCFYAIDVYDDKITNSPYFSLTTKNYQFSDVETVERECTLGKNNKKFHPYMSYKLIMNDGVKINIYSLKTKNKSQMSHLDAIETISPKLINAQIIPTIVDSAPIVKTKPTITACKDFIRHAHDEKTANRMFEIFDL